MLAMRSFMFIYFFSIVLMFDASTFSDRTSVMIEVQGYVCVCVCVRRLEPKNEAEKAAEMLASKSKPLNLTSLIPLKSLLVVNSSSSSASCSPTFSFGSLPAHVTQYIECFHGLIAASIA